MLTAKSYLFLALGIVVAFFVISWIAAERGRPGRKRVAPTWLQAGIGFVANFFDTLGIGSFATTTSFYKLWKQVPDQVIPGTLNVGHALPTVVEALAYITIIQVDMTTLTLMIAASVLGAWLGAGIVAGWPRRRVQIGMGAALLAAALLMVMTQANLFPGGGDTLDLQGMRLYFGLGGNFVLGALMTLGIGLYAPCLILVSLLGMMPTTAFPIMMGSCAFLMPVASVRFIRKGGYNLQAAIGLMVGGLPAVPIAAFIVKSMPLYYVRWLVVAVVVYTALALLRSAYSERRS